MYHSIIDSLKVRKLHEAAQLDYFLLLCCASEYRERTEENTGNTGLTVPDAVWRTRSATLEGTFPVLLSAGLVTQNKDGRICISGWAEKQFASDDVSARTRKSKEKEAGNVPENVPPPVLDTEQSRIKKRAKNVEPTPGFQAFWKSFPNDNNRRQDKKDCCSLWIAKGLEPRAAEIIAHVEAMKRTDSWRRGFEPLTTTYLRGERWDDGLPETVERLPM